MSVEDVWGAVEAYYGDEMERLKMGVSSIPIPAGFEERFWEKTERTSFREIGTLGDVFAHEYLSSISPARLTIRGPPWDVVLKRFLGEVKSEWEKMYVVYIYDELRAMVSWRYHGHVDVQANCTLVLGQDTITPTPSLTEMLQRRRSPSPIAGERIRLINIS